MTLPLASGACLCLARVVLKLPQGSGTIKAGFAGEEQPSCYIPSLCVSALTSYPGSDSGQRLTNSVGRPKHTRVMAGAIQDDLFIGRRAQELRGLLKIKYPMEHGVVTDWDDMERIWGWVYGEGLKALSEEVSRLWILDDIDLTCQHPVLLTEAPLNPRQNRDVAAQIFFETFNVPAFFTSVQAVLSLFVCYRKIDRLARADGLGTLQAGQRA